MPGRCGGRPFRGLRDAGAAARVPKVIVSPSASGRRTFAPFVGSSDVLVMHSVVDILGLNPIAISVFDNATAAVVGMAKYAGGHRRVSVLGAWE